MSLTDAHGENVSVRVAGWEAPSDSVSLEVYCRILTAVGGVVPGRGDGMMFVLLGPTSRRTRLLVQT